MNSISTPKVSGRYTEELATYVDLGDSELVASRGFVQEIPETRFSWTHGASICQFEKGRNDALEKSMVRMLPYSTWYGIEANKDLCFFGLVPNEQQGPSNSGKSRQQGLA